jgi:hypothetical protein
MHQLVVLSTTWVAFFHSALDGVHHNLFIFASNHLLTLINTAPTLVPYLLPHTDIPTQITSYPIDLATVLTTYPTNLATLLITYPTNLTTVLTTYLTDLATLHT